MSPVARDPAVYTFLCKQGQEKLVAQVLVDLGLEPTIDPPASYVRGSWRSDGILVHAPLNGLSKNSINKAMKKNDVPGARG